MSFEKYMHVERWGNAPVVGIEEGECYVFPKLDGTNASIWLEGSEMRFGSRRREVDIVEDNQGFAQAMCEPEKFKEFFRRYGEELRLYGEWLVPHTLRTYTKDAWRKFYVFDVHNGERFLAYEEYKPILEEFGIDYIPAICKVKYPTYERLVNQLEKNTFLIEDGKGVGEGIVIKRYDFVNRFGRTIWAKIVRNDFKTKHAKVSDVTELNETKMVEDRIVEKYVTKALVDKEYSKAAVDGWESKYIPRLLNTVYYCLVTEEMWQIVKDFKNPTINFKTLATVTTRKIKEIRPELF